MAHFTHEQQIKISEESFATLVAYTSRRSRFWRLALTVVLGLLCLLWTYTFALGLVLLLGALTAFVAPPLLRTGAATTYRRTPYLSETLTYKVTDSELAVMGPGMRFQCNWRYLRLWRERDGWIILACWGMPEIFLRVETLQGANVYDEIVRLAQECATERTKEAKRGQVT
jgi:hypothetical protein